MIQKMRLERNSTKSLFPITSDGNSMLHNLPSIACKISEKYDDQIGITMNTALPLRQGIGRTTPSSAKFTCREILFMYNSDVIGQLL